jgi:MFS family permease
LAAGVVGLILANILSPQALTDYGWRIALLIGAAVVPFALIIRRRLPETLHDVRVRPGKNKVGGLLWLGVLGLCMLASATIGTYTMNYMTTFANRTLGFPAAWSFAATIAVGAAAMSGALLAGLISDRVGRKPVMIGASLALLGLVVPCFTIMVHYHSLAVLLAGTGLMALFVGMCAAGAVISLTESLPINLRAGSLGIIYALSIASFGGTAQFIVTWLIDVTSSPLAPAWYMTGAVALGLVAMLMMRESAPIKKR